MKHQDDEQMRENETLPTLWKRAHWWRATLIAATVLSVAAIAIRAERGSEQFSPPVDLAVRAQPMPESHPPLSQKQVPSGSPTATNELSSPQKELPVPTPAPVGASDEEEQTLATCHPHLTGERSSLPQIDVQNMPQPNLGHMKIHMWVNGAGSVTRDVISEANYGSPAEQQAAMVYASRLIFSLPNTRECRSREVEVIGDVFEGRVASGKWSTYVRLYPKLFFNNAGILQRAD